MHSLKVFYWTGSVRVMGIYVSEGELFPVFGSVQGGTASQKGLLSEHIPTTSSTRDVQSEGEARRRQNVHKQEMPLPVAPRTMVHG